MTKYYDNRAKSFNGLITSFLVEKNDGTVVYK